MRKNRCIPRVEGLDCRFLPTVIVTGVIVSQIKQSLLPPPPPTPPPPPPEPDPGPFNPLPGTDPAGLGA